MERILRVLVAAACCHVGIGHAAEIASQGQEVTVVAIAIDAQVVVLRDAKGTQHRYKVGDDIAGADWRVERITRGHVVMRSSQRFAGEALIQRAKIGDSLRFEVPSLPKLESTPHPVIVHAIPRSGQQGGKP